MASTENYATLSLYVYDVLDRRINRPILPPGWTEIDLKIDNFYGFSYGLFQGPDGEIVLAYTGSNEGIDWLSNISDGLGLGSVQAAAAAVVFARAREQYGANITLTGHSLGGGLASIMSVWFNRPAVVFDHAPFELASRNPLFVQAAKVALALGGFELGEFLGYDGILNFATRELNVQGHHIEGEALQYVRAIAPTIGDSEALIVGNGLDGRDLHSMTLYVAAKMSPSFAQGTLQSAHFLPVIVDTNLYNTNAGKSIEKNFLIDLIRSEQSNIGNGKLSHFATDLHRLGQDLSGLSEAAQKAIVAQAVEWYYWQSSDYAGQEFSTRDGALLQYTSAMGASLVGAQNKAADYVSKWLTPVANDHGEFYYQSFGSAQQWSVATGATTDTVATARDVDQTQMFIGQGGNDTFNGGHRVDVMFAGAGDDRLSGGNGNDLMHGNAGADTLDGGSGNDMLQGGSGTDTYNFNGAFGKDTVLDSDGNGLITADGVTLTGGKRLDDGIWVSDDKQWRYVLTERDELIISNGSGTNGITINGWSTMGGNQLGIVLDDAPASTTPAEGALFYNGDQRAKLIGTETQLGVSADHSTYGTYAWGETSWANDGTLINGKAEPNFNDVIYATAAGANGSVMRGWGGHDALSGSAGVDDIFGGEGNDLMGGGAGSDHIRGENGDDTILSATTLNAALRTKPTDSYSAPAGSTLLSSGSTWAVYRDSANTIFVDGAASITMDSASDVVDAGAGNDIVVTGKGADSILAGADDDHVWAGEGSDIVIGGTGNDYLFGDGLIATGSLLTTVGAGHGADHVDGGDGDDQIVGGGGSDGLFGGAGNDLIHGDDYAGDAIDVAYHGDDYLDGEAGNDTLYGGAGNDILIGGTGDDYLEGGEGQDIYLFNKGDGVDTVVDSKPGSALVGQNTVRFGAGIEASSIKLSLGSLLLDLGGGDQIHIENFDKNDVFNTVSVGRFEFADGSSLSSSQLLERGFDLDGGAGNDSLVGTNTTDRLRGLSGNDYLHGAAGNDTLDGGAGANLLMGGAGNDTYVVRTPDVLAQVNSNGRVLLQTVIDDTEGQSTVQLDVLRSDVLVGTDGNGYGLTWASGADTAGVYFKDMNTAGRTTVVFADGAQVTLRELAGDTLDTQVMRYTDESAVFGGTQDDYLGASGDQSVVSGGQGNDLIDVYGRGQTVEYRRGDGLDTLGGYDSQCTVALLGDFNPADLQLELDAQGQLSVWLGAGAEAPMGDRLNLNIYSNNLGQSRLIDRFVFDDGRVLRFADLLARGVKVVGTPQDDVLVGTDAADLVRGGAGFNQLSAGAGDDTYVVESGSSHWVDDSQGHNAIRLAGVTDWGTVQLSRPDAFSNDLLLTAGADTTITLKDALLRADSFIVVLQDGQSRRLSGLSGLIAALDPIVVTGDEQSNVMAGSDLGSALDGGYGDDRITGGAGADWLVGGDGADEMAGGGGDDTLFGGSGDDTFVVGAGGGNDQVFDQEGSNTLRFAEGIDPTQITVERLPGGTDVRLGLGSDHSVTVRRALEGAVTRYTFANGTEWTYADLINRFATTDGLVAAGDDLDNTVNGGAGADLILGNMGNDQLHGHAGADELRGGDGNDALYGGAGDDLLDGGAEADTFFLALGDGVDRLVDTDGASALVFGAGIGLHNLSGTHITIEGVAYLRLAYSATDAVCIQEGVQLPGVAFRFADGVALTQDQVYALAVTDGRVAPPFTEGNDVVQGYAGDDVLLGGAGVDHLLGGHGHDTLNGGAGNDTLEGGAGHDVYVLEQNGGRDVLLEGLGQSSTIGLAQGDEGTLTYARSGSALQVFSGLLNASFYIPDFYLNTGGWTLTTSQGTTFDLGALAAIGLQDKTMEEQRDGFYAGLVANAGAVELGTGQLFTSSESRLVTDTYGNQTAYTFNRDRTVLTSDDAVIQASANGFNRSEDTAYLGMQQYQRTYDVTDVSYSYSQQVTAGQSYLTTWSPLFFTLGGYSVAIPTGYTTYVSNEGLVYLVENDRVATTITRSYTTRTVTEDVAYPIYRTEVTAQSVVEDVRGGDQSNAIELSGTASKLVSAGGGDDVVVRLDATAHDTLGLLSNSPADWVDGGTGNDRIQLGAGRDQIHGGTGADYLDGAAGADTYVVDANDDGWDTIYDSAAATVHVELVSSAYGELDDQLISELQAIMPNARLYREYASTTLIGDVVATAANLNELLRIDRERPAFDQPKEIAQQWNYPPGRSVLRSDGLDAWIAQITDGGFVRYAESGAEIERPSITFSEAQAQAFQLPVSDTVRLGAGIVLANLQLGWDTVELDGFTQDALMVSWGGAGGLKVVMPDAGDASGVGIEVFEFADGSRLGMSQMLQLAPPRPTVANALSVGTPIGAQQLFQGDALAFSLPTDAFVATAGKSVQYSARLVGSDNVLPPWLTIDAQTGVLSGTPGNEDVGSLQIEVTARQSSTNSATQTFVLKVLNTNDAPVVAGMGGDMQIDAGVPLEWAMPTYLFNDMDVGDHLSYSVESAGGGVLPAWLSQNPLTGQLEGVPGSEHVGSWQLQWVATDLSGARATQAFSLNVLAVPQVQVTGTSGDDTLTGGLLAADFDGREGNDTIIGTNGADLLNGGAGNDAMAGGLGNDTYLFSPGDGQDTLYEQDGKGTLRFDAGIVASDMVFSLRGNDLVLRIRGTTDQVTVVGWGAGLANRIDRMEFSDGTAWTAEQIENALVQTPITGTSRNDVLVGTAGNDLIVGGVGSDNMAGGEGDDTFLINGTDSVHDRIQGDAGYDMVLGGDGDDTIRLRSFTGDATVELIDGGLGVNTIAGTAYADTINLSGTEVLNIGRIEGGAGNDNITGSAGNDLIVGGAGSDTMAGGGGDDTFLINGTDSVHDRIQGDAGYDMVLGGDGDDTIRLRSFTGDATVELIDGGLGVNTIAGTAYADTINLSGTEVLNIGRIEGGAGNDKITGSAGNDLIVGGAGADILAGGLGDDTYWIGPGDGADSVRENDTTPGNVDVLEFMGGIASDQLWFRKRSNNLEISVIGTTDKVTVTNWYLGSAYHVEQFKSSDGKMLLDSQVQNLVSAMAAFAPPPAGQTTLSADYAASLQPVLSANWQ